MSKPQAPPAAPQQEDAMIGAERERKRIAAKQGFGSTLLTGPQGDTSTPALANKSLMGGAKTTLGA